MPQWTLRTLNISRFPRCVKEFGDFSDKIARPRKAAALVKPVVDMDGIEDVDLSSDGEEA